MDGAFHHREALLGVDLPERLAPFGQRVAAPDVVDQDVENAVVGAHAIEQLDHRLLLGVVDALRDPGPARGGHQLGGFLDGLRSLRVDLAAAAAAAGAVDGGARFAESARDAAPGAARRAGHQRDLAPEGQRGSRRIRTMGRISAVVLVHGDVGSALSQKALSLRASRAAAVRMFEDDRGTKRCRRAKASDPGSS